MHEKNEYMSDGRLYVRDIKACSCRMKTGEKYTLDCSIHQRGLRQYTYCSSNGWITTYTGGRFLWLSETAKSKVEEAVNRFEEKLAMFRTREAGRIDFAGGESVGFLIRDGRIEYMKHSISSKTGEDVYEPVDTIKFPSNYEKQTALYIGGERVDYQNIPERYAGYLPIPILPVLSEEYDIDYVVDAKTISEEDHIMLEREYQLLHRPYFAMKGCTHSKYKLNPHTKIGVDAEVVEANAITFQEFMDFYRNEPKNTII